jgi:hypothetical protein
LLVRDTSAPFRAVACRLAFAGGFFAFHLVGATYAPRGARRAGGSGLVARGPGLGGSVFFWDRHNMFSFGRLYLAVVTFIALLARNYKLNLWRL